MNLLMADFAVQTYTHSIDTKSRKLLSAGYMRRPDVRLYDIAGPGEPVTLLAESMFTELLGYGAMIVNMVDYNMLLAFSTTNDF